MLIRAATALRQGSGRMRSLSFAVSLLVLCLGESAASACGGDTAHPAQHNPANWAYYDLIVDGSWHYAGETTIQIEVNRTLAGPKLKELTLPDTVRGKDTIIITCGRGPFEFTREVYPEGRSYKGRFFLQKVPDGTYRLRDFIDKSRL
jgi:hypothetical protein